MKVSKEWIMLALSKKDLNNWEEWGFALFKNSDFKTQISLMEKQLNNMDDSKFKNEIKKKNTKEKSYGYHSVYLSLDLLLLRLQSLISRIHTPIGESNLISSE